MLVCDGINDIVESRSKVPKLWLALMVLAALIWSGDSNTLCSLDECENCVLHRSDFGCECPLSDPCWDYWRQRHRELELEESQWEQIR
ncbi:hypothetical protein PoB_003528100 [Plakobranchus ocellatus]|uniref:Uncharacterized protein n=1 Tax=Plakobranchus ocellatus TaxID=259542 RepID=A0AAV4AQB4_9GAST|nr:hypothetical protein PoB_003528100 [Plakobranchus ocellatus]